MAMAALLVAMTIMALAAGVAMPVWKQAAQREKEAELIFRGEQYARAVGLYQRKMGPGTLPPNLEILVDQRFLRKKYKDPITGGDFQLLAAAQAAGQFGQPGQQQAGAQAGRAGLQGGRQNLQQGQAGQGLQTQTQLQGGGAGGVGSTFRPAQGAATFTTQQGQALGGRVGQPGQGGQGGQGPVTGGIIGVASTSTDTSIRRYNNRDRYSEWMFVFAQPARGGGSAQPGQGGARATTPGVTPGRDGRGGPAGRGAAGRGSGGAGGPSPFGPAQQPGRGRPGF